MRQDVDVPPGREAAIAKRWVQAQLKQLGYSLEEMEGMTMTEIQDRLAVHDLQSEMAQDEMEHDRLMRKVRRGML